MYFSQNIVLYYYYFFFFLLGVATSGLGQAVVPLSPGVTYYTTVRAVTNGGNILQTVTDGFTPDTSPPSIQLEGYALLSVNP